MESVLLQRYFVPENVRKQFAKYLVLELYTDRLVGKGGPNGDITYFFKNYIRVTWTPANLGTQFAQIVFITAENAGNYIVASNLTSLNDTNKIPFCSGMFSYEAANNYTKALFMDIKRAMDAYQELQSQQSANGPVVQVNFSAADELKKFKDLLDMGVISQEEFDAKKNELIRGVKPISAPPQPSQLPPSQPALSPAAPRFCPRCGTPNDQSGNFCPKCGNKLR